MTIEDLPRFCVNCGKNLAINILERQPKYNTYTGEKFTEYFIYFVCESLKEDCDVENSEDLDGLQVTFDQLQKLKRIYTVIDNVEIIRCV